ncbi:hypothetical protein EV401DRAFT_1932481, partial [Pisolithus croceorrhizus]
MDMLEAPDKGSQCAGDKVKEEDLQTMSSKALETPGDLPFTSSERAKTRTGHQKPENEVVDTRHMVDVLPMFEVGSTGQAWYGKHAKELQAPDEGGQHASDEVERSRDLPKSSSEVLKPMSIEDSQRAWTNSETIANVPDPPSTPMKRPTPHVKHPRLRKWPSAQACSATTTKFDLSYTRRSGKRQEMQRLKLDCKRAPGHPKRTYQGCSTCETPPDEAWGMGVYSSARVGWGDSTMTGSIMTTLEIRGLSTRTVETQVHLPHWDTTRKEPDKAGDTGGGGDDTASKDFINLRGVEKTLLAISRSQQGEREAEWRNGLPVPPETPPNSYIHPPGTIGDPHRHGGMKTRAEKVRRARRIKMRGRTHHRDHIHGTLAISNPNEVSQHLQNVANAYQHQGVPPRLMWSTGRPMSDRAAAWQIQYKEKRAGRSPGSPIMPALHLGSTNYVPKSSKSLRHRARLRSNAENKSRQAKRSTAVRNQPTWDNLPSKGDNGGKRHGDATRSGYANSHGVKESLLTDEGSQHSERKAKQADGSPAPPGPCPSSTGHLPRLYEPTHRRGRVKSKAENVSNTHMRQNAYHVQAATERPLRLFFAPSNRPLDSVRGLWTVNAHYNEVG